MTRRLAAIMFTDIAGYTAMTQADEAGTLAVLAEQERLARPVFEAYRGRKVKSIGDGQLVEFPDALDSVECAIELQKRIRERNERGHPPPWFIRVGIHLGDVVQRGADILGDAVNIAARVEPLAAPGGICLTEPVYLQVRNKASCPIERLGLRSLRGIAEPIAIYTVRLPGSGGDRRPVVDGYPRLAVLPLVNISPDPHDEYFADGLTEELITVLSQIRGVRVISRTSVSQYKGTSKSLAQIGSELGVGSVLEGSVRKAGDRLRIAVQLIDTRTDEHRWAETFDRQLANVFDIQAEVAERTAEALRVQLLTAEREALAERPTPNLRAYESYLQGIQAWRRLTALDPARERQVVQFFEEAIRIDPGFSAAYSYLANILLGAMGISRPGREVLPRARELVARSLELNPSSADAHTARGNLAHQGDLDWARAESEYREALALNPSSSSARFWFGYLLTVLQRFEEAQEQLRATIDLDPLWLLPRANLARTLLFSGDLEGAIVLGERLLQDFPGTHSIQGQLAYLYACAGRADDARQLVQGWKDTRDWDDRGSRGIVLTLVGDPSELRALVHEWEQASGPEYYPTINVAGAYSVLGKPENAISLLENDWTRGDRLLWSSYQDPVFDPIRHDPRFLALLQASRLPTTIERSLVDWKRP